MSDRRIRDERWAGIDPSLYFVTDSALCARAGRTVVETAAAAVAGGAGIVQVRDKALPDAEFLTLARQVLVAISKVTAGTGRRVPVVVNDRVQVARILLDEGEDVHVHVGQSDAAPEQVRRLLGPALLIGLSVGTVGEVAAAQAAGVADLLGISPAFDTTTKSDAGTGLGLEGVRQLAGQARLPSVAIGGIDLARAARLRASGVVGVCVVSAICLAADPQAMARQLHEAFAPPR